MRRILRVVKATLVLSIVFLMTVDSANACRLLRLLFHHNGRSCCHTANVCDGSCGGGVASMPVVSGPIVSAPIYSSGPIVSAPIASEIISAPIVSDYVSSPIVSDYVSSPIVSAAPAGNCCCCGGGGVIENAPIVDSFVPSGVVDDGFVESGYMDGYPVDASPVMDSYDSSTVIEGDIYQPSPVEVVPSDGTIIEPYDAGGEVITPVPTPEDSIPATTADPVDSPLDSAVDPPADAGGDALFNDTTGDAGVDEGFGGGEAADGDFGAGLGGGEAVDSGDAFSAPADDAAAPPPVEEDNNLFGGGDAGAADDLPADDNLFDGGGDAPLDDAGGDGLFEGGGDGDAPIDDADDLFSANGTSDTITTSSERGESLFEAPSSTAPIGDSLPGDDEAPAGDDLDDLFSKKSNASEGMRVWTDDTGKYKTVGRLVVIAKTHVRLLKKNGRHSTVPLNRLSNTDLDYVMAVAKRLSDDSKGLASL